MVPSNAGNSCDALLEPAHPPPQEDPGETPARKKKDTRKSRRIKLSARALKLVEASSGKRISKTKIEFSDKSTQDGGTFADVSAATLHSIWRRRRKVAVKQLRLINDMTEEKLFSAMVHELRVLDKLSHPNIVKIIGFVEDVENRIAWLVFPWEENGNLRQFLRSATWELPERVSLITDVIRGLEYLHTRQPPIRHGDLKSLNILVNSSNRAVITDFGSARIINLGATPTSYIPPRLSESAELTLAVSNDTLTLTGPGCSARWAPPEFLNESALDLASDVWAVGWIAWEAITDHFPFEELDSEVHVTLRVIEGQLPMIYDHRQLSQIHHLCGIMQKCWKLDPRERISATECRKAIVWIPQAIPSTKSHNQSTIPSARLLLQIGDIHRLHNRRKEALEMFEQGSAIAQSTGDQATLANLLIRIAETHLAGSKYIEAEVSYTESLVICKTIRYDWGRMSALLGLGAIRGAQCKYIEAEAFFAEVLAASCKTIGSDGGRARALRGLGGVRGAQCKYIEAEAFFAEALAICKTVGDYLGRANALLGLGDVQRSQSNYIEAEASFAEALSIFKTVGDDLGRASALVGLGDVRGAQCKYIEAEAFHTEALVIYKTIGQDLDRARALRGLGGIRRAQCKYIEAEAFFAEALAICKTIGDDLGRASALLSLGYVQIAQSNYIEAEALFAEALSICKAIGHDLGRAGALVGLGGVRAGQCKYIEAEAYFAEALAIYKHVRDDLGRVTCSLGLAEIWIHQERYVEAKGLIEDIASISERINYAWGKDTSDELLHKILETEGSPKNPLTSTTTNFNAS